jgi:regulatory protein YycI of two-component signal transduction system YycFG
MDWSRAKTILLMAFLTLNLILGYQLWASRVDQSELASGSQGTVEEVDRLLKSKGIRVAVEIPKEAPKLGGITVQFDDQYKSGLDLTLPEPFTWSAVPAKSPAKEQFLKQYIEWADKYMPDPVNSTSAIHSFMEMVGTYPIFDIRLDLKEVEGRIVSYSQAYVEVLPSEDSKENQEQKVIPANIALRSLAENYLPGGTTITDIRLGYHGQLYNSQTQFILPSWRIATSQGDLYYINALNGAVEAPQQD